MNEWKPVPRADVAVTEHGHVPMSEGWFVTNIADARAQFDDGVQYHAGFRSPDCRFAEYGVNVQWIFPGHANGKYHREDVQESILVLQGQAVLIVEESEQLLRQWDFVHLPAGTAHIIVGTGAAPCAVLFAGSNRADGSIHYPVSDVAAKYGASVSVATDDPAVAYAGEVEPAVTRMPWPEPPVATPRSR